MDHLSSSNPSQAPPPSFGEAVKDALVHLYDVTKLRASPLNRWLMTSRGMASGSGPDGLRQLLLDAIERMNPGPHLPDTARQRRSFQILQLRYVEAMPFREVMDTLALGQSQYHREQRHAVEMLTTYLWESFSTAEPAITDADRGTGTTAQTNDDLSVLDLGAHAEDEVHVRTVLDDIVALLGPIAEQRQVRLRLQLTDDDVVAMTSRTLLRQVIISVMGLVIDCASDGDVEVSMRQRGTTAVVDVCLNGPHRAISPESTSGEGEKLALGQRLAHSLGGELRLVEDTSTRLQLTVSFPMNRLTLLAIDDNRDLIQLIERYLADQKYAVLSASSVAEGIALAQSAMPDVILLDLMLPHQDGWDALQLLRHDPVTAEIPIIVCSVLGEQKLAEALGAAAFIRKPVLRPALLEALQQCVLARPSVAEGNRATLGFH